MSKRIYLKLDNPEEPEFADWVAVRKGGKNKGFYLCGSSVSAWLRRYGFTKEEVEGIWKSGRGTLIVETNDEGLFRCSGARYLAQVDSGRLEYLDKRAAEWFQDATGWDNWGNMGVRFDISVEA